MVDDAFAVMDAVGWPSATVFGGSMGAAIAQAMALFHPERVRAVVSMSGLPVGASPLKTLRYIKFGVFPKFRGLKMGTRQEQIESTVAIMRVIASPAHPFPEEWAREVAAISYDRWPRDPKTTQRQLAAGRATKYPPLSAITAPTLVICGEADPIVKLAGSRDIARLIRGAKLVTYPGMGHNLPQELWPQIVSEIAGLTAN